MRENLELATYRVNHVKENNFIGLDLSCIGLSEVPKTIVDLSGLDVLDLSHNQIIDPPHEIKELKKLRILHLEGNKIKKIPKEIGELINLEYLYINDNEITELPREIGQLSSLKRLKFNNNKIKKLPKEIGNLTKLRDLGLSNNKIRSFPVEMEALRKIETLDFEGNPVQPPLEIIHRGIEAIFKFFISIENQETLKVYEAKLLIVGEGNVGKTCLMKKLINPNYQIKKDESSTEGIDIRKWKISTPQTNNFIINLWDFGGQEIYHATHQFFLTKRSLYLFVWEARKDDDLISFDYWLNVIKLLSGSSPVFVVQNKIDVRLKPLDEVSLKKAFPNIEQFHKVSAETGHGIGELIGSIKDRIIGLEHIGDTLPKVWIEIRQELENLDKNYILYSEYEKICKRYNLDNEDITYLSQYYHDLGVFLNFKDNDILRNVVFLKPEWVTNAVYNIVNTKKVIEQFGIFNYNDLKQIWTSYSEESFIHLLELMKKFELCFQLSEKYIIPELLRSNQPSFHWDYEGNLRFEYHYSFMPKGIITRFIVRNHDLSENNIFWKQGIVLKRENTEALIISEYFNRKIRIWIKGSKKREMLSIIRRDIDYIHKTLNYPDVKEMIPCICRDCKHDKSPHFFDYSILYRYKEKLKDEITCPKSVEEVSVDKLLGEVEYLEHLKDQKFSINIRNLTVYGQANIANEIKKVSKED